MWLQIRIEIICDTILWPKSVLKLREIVEKKK